MKAFFLSCLLLLQSVCSAQSQTAPEILPGVSRSLAEFRKQQVDELSYKLNFNIPGDRNAVIPASEEIRFNLHSIKYPVQLDFKGHKSQIIRMQVNGKSTEVNYQKEHLILDASLLLQGENLVQIEFTAGSAALNRNEDYLYTLFVPDRARTVFPCFDQPNLKAIFDLQLEIPKNWTVLANGQLKDTTIFNQRKICTFLPSDKISTYLFAFAAGKFKSVEGKAGRYNAQFLYRETDATKIKNSMD